MLYLNKEQSGSLSCKIVYGLVCMTGLNLYHDGVRQTFLAPNSWILDKFNNYKIFCKIVRFNIIMRTVILMKVINYY